MNDILMEVLLERFRQKKLWGEQHHPDGTGASYYTDMAIKLKSINNERSVAGRPSWDLILNEEVHEALSETVTSKLRKELIQVAAVCVTWVEDIDSRDPI